MLVIGGAGLEGCQDSRLDPSSSSIPKLLLNLGARTTMKWKEIIEKFKDEWVLIEVKEVDESYSLKEGKVIAHSKDKSEIYEQLLKLKEKNLYIEYTGKIPEDLAVVLFYEDI